ncbi:hypothetical protein [uncultured Metabacillus sp.]|uniref:hypothetical protein n=1 Tax=uncultured Metabacillus sp. TaxID=2860135 RepID=UPI002608A1EA|nr:hypothetical protein [uncultured Metabacillus sp.]
MLNLLDKKIDANLWEDICSECYRKRYQSKGFHTVPANYKGDFGIEGFTSSGIVYQCYYPEKEYNDDDLYKHQRKKMTDDLNKLINNGDGLRSIGINKVREWHFVIPEYRDKRILIHRTNKKKDVIKSKIEKGLTHISDNFEILIKVEADFFEELSMLLNLKKDYKLDFAFRHTGEVDWSLCPSEKLENIQRKLKAILIKEDGTVDEMPYKRLVNLYVSFYTKGIETLDNLRINSPVLYENIIQFSHTLQVEAQMKCDLNISRTLNNTLFQQLLVDFELKLKEAFGEVITATSISELKNNLVSAWLADCPLEFR